MISTTAPPVRPATVRLSKVSSTRNVLWGWLGTQRFERSLVSSVPKPWRQKASTSRSEERAKSSAETSDKSLPQPNGPWKNSIVERHSPRSFGSAYAVFNLSYAVGMAAGPIASGVLKPALGFGLTLVILSAVSALALIFLSVPPPAPCEG